MSVTRRLKMITQVMMPSIPTGSRGGCSDYHVGFLMLLSISFTIDFIRVEPSKHVCFMLEEREDLVATTDDS
jgi:hypothetical protein